LSNRLPVEACYQGCRLG